MKEACELLKGSHDFRNFCKIDIENTTNFVRTIHKCEVVSVSKDMNYLEVKGSAFLWHQIRLIMGVLFNVGMKLEAPSIVTELLNVELCPSRPSFNMADELPLLLYSSEYEEGMLNWQFTEKNISRLIERLNARLGRELIRCEVTKSFLDVITTTPFPTCPAVDNCDHEEISSVKKRQKHRPFMERLRCKSVQERMLASSDEEDEPDEQERE